MKEAKVGIKDLMLGALEMVHRPLHGFDGSRDPQRYLARVGPIIEKNLPKPDFTGKEITKLEEWLKDDPQGHKNALFTTYLDYSLLAYGTSETGGVLTETNFGIAGHDMENVVHTVTSVLAMIDSADGELGNYVTWEILAAGLNENLGRLIEGDDYSHQATGFLLARGAIKMVGGNRIESQEELRLISHRVLGNIYDHGGKNVGDPLSDLVRQSNRLQMCEPRFLRRSLLYDVAQVGQAIFAPMSSSRQTDLSITFKPEATSMDWAEFYTRNLFPFEDSLNDPNLEVYRRIMRENQMVANDRRANSVALLILLAGGVDNELYNQTFAPELGLVGETYWSKKKIPDEIFRSGVEKYHAFVDKPHEFPELEGLDEKEQIARILGTMSSFVPEGLLDRIYQRYDELNSAQQQNLQLALRFSLMLHNQALDEELELTKRLSKSPNQHIAKVARFALDYLKLR